MINALVFSCVVCVRDSGCELIVYSAEYDDNLLQLTLLSSRNPVTKCNKILNLVVILMLEYRFCRLIGVMHNHGDNLLQLTLPSSRNPASKLQRILLIAI